MGWELKASSSESNGAVKSMFRSFECKTTWFV